MPCSGWLCRMRKARSRAGYVMQPTLPDLPQAPPRSEAAKEAEAEQTAKHLKQQLPLGPQYLTGDELVEAVKPSDAQMALCSLYCNRCAKSRSAAMRNSAAHKTKAAASLCHA